MFRLSDSNVAQWGKTAGKKLPHAVDTICPFCGRSVTFALIAWHQARHVGAHSMKSRCSGCGKSARFLWIEGSELPEDPLSDEKALYIWPSPKLIRGPINGLEAVASFPARLKKDYSSALNTYNVRLLPAAAVLCRRVLEGLCKILLPEDCYNLALAQQLKALPDHVDLKDPILKLADGIRLGGNIGAHFDDEREPDQETIEMMLDLLDYIIEYLFILPGRIDKLHDKLASSEKNGT